MPRHADRAIVAAKKHAAVVLVSFRLPKDSIRHHGLVY